MNWLHVGKKLIPPAMAIRCTVLISETAITMAFVRLDWEERLPSSDKGGVEREGYKFRRYARIFMAIPDRSDN